MPTVTKEREGYHNLFLQVPTVLWQALLAEADERGESAGRALTRILAARYRMPANQLPKPKRAGRPSKRP